MIFHTFYIRYCLYLMVSLAALVSCVPYGRDLSNVVEKSKRDKPNWAHLDSSIFHDNQASVRYVYFRDGLVDLSLGLQQGEVGIRSVSEYKIYRTIIGEIREISPSSPVWLDRNAQMGLKNAVSDLLRQQKDALSQIRDIYFEKVETIASLRDRPKYSYRVYFLAEFEKKVIGDLLIDLVVRLRNSSQPELQEMSQTLEGQLK